MKGKIFLILLLSLLLSGAMQTGALAPEREKVLSKMIANWLANWHYSGKKIDDDFSVKSLAQYDEIPRQRQEFPGPGRPGNAQRLRNQGGRRIAAGRLLPAAPGPAAAAAARAAGAGLCPRDPGQAFRLLRGRADRARLRQARNQPRPAPAARLVAAVAEIPHPDPVHQPAEDRPPRRRTAR